MTNCAFKKFTMYESKEKHRKSTKVPTAIFNSLFGLVVFLFVFVSLLTRHCQMSVGSQVSKVTFCVQIFK